MLLLDIHYSKAGLEDHRHWQKNRDRSDAIYDFCKGNQAARNAFLLFINENVEGMEMIRTEAKKRDVTEGFIEAVISNV